MPLFLFNISSDDRLITWWVTEAVVRTVLPNRKILQAIRVILNFLDATGEKYKEEVKLILMYVN